MDACQGKNGRFDGERGSLPLVEQRRLHVKRVVSAGEESTELVVEGQVVVDLPSK